MLQLRSNSGPNAKELMLRAGKITSGQKATDLKKAVRDWIAGVVGTKYRVTEGHVVTADGRKSKQFDVIVVWDAASGTLYGSRPGEPELVRAECVAAVGEVKSSWYDHNEVLRSYSRLVSEIADLQEGLLVENRARFGEIKDDTSMAELAQPVTGRAWINKSYNFVIALSLGKCELINLTNDMTTAGNCANGRICINSR